MVLTTGEAVAINKYAKEDERLNNQIRMFLGRLIYLNNLPQNKKCYAHNAYFAKEFNKSERTIQRWLKILQDLGYITIKYTWKGTKIVNRVITIAADFLFKILDIIRKKKHAKISLFNTNVAGNVVVNKKVYYIDTKEKKDLLYLYNKSTKEKVLKNSRPKNYDEVLKLWSDKNLEGTARTFWMYNTKRAWANIRNWKHAAISWAKKTKDNLAAFKADKTKPTEQYTTDYESVLPDLSYNSWDIL